MLTGRELGKRFAFLFALAILAVLAAGCSSPTDKKLAAYGLRRGKLAGAVLKGADLELVQLPQEDLSHSDLTGANLRGANLEGANLSFAKLTKADMRAIRLRDTEEGKWVNTNLKGANLTRARLDETLLRGADLQGAKLDEASLKNADLSAGFITDRYGSCLATSNCMGASFRNADLRGAKLTTCLKDANLDGADLRGAKLGLVEGATLRNADLRGADLSAAFGHIRSLKGAIYDSSTMWPKGFKPETRGVRKVEREDTNADR